MLHLSHFGLFVVYHKHQCTQRNRSFRSQPSHTMSGGETLNLSPNFEARFSQIDITPTTGTKTLAAPTKSKRSPTKKYPVHIYPPSNTTPSKSPFLSTAKRAESRSKSGTKTSSEPQEPSLPPSRVSSTSSHDKRNVLNPASSSQPAPKSFSFMRETSFSINKQVDQVIGINN